MYWYFPYGIVIFFFNFSSRSADSECSEIKDCLPPLKTENPPQKYTLRAKVLTLPNFAVIVCHFSDIFYISKAFHNVILHLQFEMVQSILISVSSAGLFIKFSRHVPKGPETQTLPPPLKLSGSLHQHIWAAFLHAGMTVQRGREDIFRCNMQPAPSENASPLPSACSSCISMGSPSPCWDGCENLGGVGQDRTAPPIHVAKDPSGS